MAKYSSYKSFNEESEAADFIETLKSHHIEFDISIVKTGLDTLYGENRFDTSYFIKLRKEDFQKADALLLALAEKDLEKIRPDYHLFSFSDDELKEILTHPEEWSEIDYLLAHKILDQRNVVIDKNALVAWRSTRLEQSTDRNESGLSLVYFGYCLAALGGILGIAIGIYLMTATKRGTDQKKMFSYPASERQHGFFIIITGMIDFLVLAAKIAWVIK